MLNIFYARESIDKEKFIYENLQKPALVIVPDQYTLEAEKQALSFLKTKSLMDVEVVTVSRLGDRALQKLGGGKATFIDKYGRHILLSKIIREEGENLKAFSKVKDKPNFILAANNFISQMKQYGVGPEELDAIADGKKEGKIKDKLKDLALIAQRYEETIQGKFVDSEDKVNLFIKKLGKLDEIKGSHIWIYGFDSFAPNTLRVIEEIMKAAISTNVALTWDDDRYDKEIFGLTGILMKRFEEIAKTNGISSNIEKIDERYAKEYQNKGIAHIEKNIYAMPYKKQAMGEDIELIQAANPYNEAETAASKVLELVRDKGMRFRDITVVCNEQNQGSQIIQRVFSEYGIPVFVDKNRELYSSGIVVAILSLIQVVKDGFRTGDIMSFLKSDLGILDVEKVELLENYAYQYNIKGSMWKKPFKYGEVELGQERMTELEELRKTVMTPLEKLEKSVMEAKTVRDFCDVFCTFLVDDIKIEEGIARLVSYQESHLKVAGQELAQETRQIWSAFLMILEQITLLLGDENFDMAEVEALILAGISVFEVGVIPPTADGVTLATTGRSRTGKTKAALVLSANEGILPITPSQGDLFTAAEMEDLAEEGNEIGKLDSVLMEEEKLAIYRTFAKPTEYMMISNCTADIEGEALRPSPISDKINKIFDGAVIKPDILNRDGEEAQLDLLGGKTNTLRHLTNNLQDMAMSGSLSDIWKETLLWYKDTDEAALIKDGIGFTNEKQNIDSQRVKALFGIQEGKALKLSPSRVEKYGRCPFAHFVSYGLKADERRVSELDPRNIGDIYHDTFMNVMKDLTSGGVTKATNPDSPLMKVTKEEVYALTEKYAKDEIKKIDDGNFEIGKRESYRTNRIMKIAKDAAWALVRQARQGDIDEIRLEEDFGPDKDIEPIEITLDDGQKIWIYGRIDRVDFLPGGQVKIIDYKSGKEYVNTKEVASGYRLQLMLYLKAAQGKDKTPAGVFYFLIHEPMEKLDNGKLLEEEKLQEKNYGSFKMKGLLIDEKETIDLLDRDLSGYSKVIPARILKDGTNKSDFSLPREEFVELQKEVDKRVKAFCQSLVNGDITLRPMKVKKTSACDKCSYKGICKFDTVFEGCNYEIVE